MSYSDRQAQLESTMRDMGRDRELGKQADARKSLNETRTKAGRRLLQRAVKDLSAELKTWKKHNPYKRPPSDLLTKIRPGVIALITSQIILDGVAGRRGYASTAAAIGRGLEEQLRLAIVKRERGPAFRALQKTAFADSRRRARSVRTRQFIALLHDVTLPVFAAKERNIAGAVLLELFIKSTGLVAHEVTVRSVGKTFRRSSLIVATAKTMAWLASANERAVEISPYYLPTVDVPFPWSTTEDGGYLTGLAVKHKLVVTFDRAQMEEVERAVMPSVYTAVNLLQSTAWAVNTAVLAVIEKLIAANSTHAGLPAFENRVPPSMPLDLERGSDAWKAARQARAIVFDYNAQQQSRRLGLTRALYVANLLKNDPKIHYPHQLDFRGRAYPVPPFLQPQGDDAAIGMLRFANARPIVTEEGMKWFLVHGANVYGNDKLATHLRQAWALEMGKICEATYIDPLSTLEWWGKAEKPFQFLAWALQYGELRLKGPSTPISIPVLMDGSNNGLQIYSLLLGDVKGAESTNCLPSDVPRDVYAEVATRVTMLLRERKAAGDVLAAEWLSFVGPLGLPRKATKRSVMTLPYGSTLFACQRYTGEWYEEASLNAGKGFGNRRFQAIMYLSALIWSSIAEQVPAAIRGKEWFQAVADVCIKHKAPCSWVAPSGFPVRQFYPVYMSARHLIKTHIGDQVRRCPTFQYENWALMDTQRQRNGIAPNYIHSLDAAVLAETLTLCYEAGIKDVRAVHDGYGSHPDDYTAMGKAIRQAYADIFSLDLLGRFAADIQAALPAGTLLPPIPLRGTLDVSQVLKSEYFFS